MYLKTLELFGFKSFADRTIIHFHEGITAIVGPNGCGKSNVLDSIRWVLGEQSAKALRGGEMTDVIFNGTDDRKPLNLAEVSLTFADCEKELGVEWSEVRVTRRVFRDGKSEYLLNNVGCRLKDIQSLFMDTGIGRSAYSIMEQGKIDQILSSRPEDRRAVFEEAAGITKFKTQKREALRKLEHTEANLIRVGDILREVKRQIGSLQRQAGKARRYQALMNELQILDTHLNRVRFESLRNEEAGINEALERLNHQLDTHQSKLADCETRIASQRLALAAIEARADAARDAVQSIQSSIQAKRSRIEFNRERGIEFNALIRRYREEVEEARARLEEQNETLTSLEKDIATDTAQITEVEARLSEISNAVNAARQRRIEAEQQADRLRRELTERDNHILRLRSEAVNNRTLSETLDARLAAINNERASLQENETATRDRLESVAAQLASAREELNGLKSEGEAAQARCTEAVASLRAIQQDLSNLNKDITARELRRDNLLELDAKAHGGGEGTAYILDGLGEPERFQKSIHGLLSTLVEVDSDFITPIEAALSQQVHAILVDEGETLDKILRLFSGGTLGRASVAANILGWREAADLPPEPPGTLGRALDKVRAAPPAAKLMRRLLGGVFIVDTLERAVALKRSNPGAYATLDGAFISREGIITAGAQTSAEQSALRRRGLIATLNAEIEALCVQREELTQRQSKVECEIEDAQLCLDDLRERYQEARLSCGVLERQVAEAERELQNFLSRGEALRRESEQQAARQQAALASLTDFEAQIQSAAGSVEILRGEHESLVASLEPLRVAETVQTNELSEARVQLATIRQKVEGLSAQKRPVEARISELRQLIESRERDSQNYQARIVESEAESARLLSEIESEVTELRTAEKTVADVLAERERAGSEIADGEAQLREIRGMVDKIQSERGQYQVKHTQTNLKTESLREYVQRRYQIDIDQFQNDSYALLKTIETVRKTRARSPRPEDDGSPDDLAAVEAGLSAPVDTPEAAALATPLANPAEQQVDWQFVENMVDELTQKLDAMGPVNLDAIQEYAELEERLAFLEKQNTDLLTAKEELVEAISRINRTTEALFSETFARLREHFQLMFRELFGGGKADLALMDSDDPLECGIEIVAKPPGKQPQAISLLSGGERAMTAVALLFAIYMVKPSPFCVLDEMDAPLDDSNINRFVKILEQFAQQSQFVVISHNKRTIAKANYLYGVTMESKGVSKLVGVRFTAQNNAIGAINSENNKSDILGSSEPPGISEAMGKSSLLHSEELVAGQHHKA